MILEDREARYYRQIELNKQYQKPIVVVRINYPGNKQNYIVNSVFNFINIELTYLYKEVINKSEGPVLIGVVDADPLELKQYGIKLENASFGRFLDFDVYDAEFKQVSRSELNLAPRTCIVCGEVAHECIRSIKHSLKEVQDAYFNIYKTELATLLSNYATESLQEELDLHPKPGLITPFSNGSHNDMNYELMCKSIESLDFYEFALACFDGYDEAKKVGIELEKSMFEATNGVNTHKGAIFLIGSILYGFIHSLMNDITLEKSLKEINKGVSMLLENPNYSSHGKDIYLRYGIKGILGDAEAGFPLLFQFLDLDKEELLRALMTKCNDTTVIYRHDVNTLEEVKALSYSTNFEELDKILIERNISPGGSADLYAGVKLVQRLKALRG